ncbi:glycoside hydrolase family 15 protein [Candidatus Uhrbacteria bacterium CG10_big_fil_rev_8_21_14_0_10_48_11]|uniref:Glycoside hydrolase family 15 protein n=1 Tax=Candidatus Uhrbacteria bacterium CG10_big_fil_rev_8_21_14_0_10_48_11 TaxID=1975037 RepID=A0A2M8LDI7_9BACT|nr:MAG: glycoside hydrolase family 15 protein [Candidatus Uhrbacteria bacterium CG10_big_fil_rev_8_21_14_0_10_48_11]
MVTVPNERLALPELPESRPRPIGRGTPIRDYFLIGNLHTAALVSRRGAVDWLCLPHFDSPSLFAALLDTERGGTFAVDAKGYRADARYVSDTAIVETLFKRGKCRFMVRDFMLPLPRIHTQAHFLERKIIAEHGPVTVRFVFSPKPNYAKEEAAVSYRGRMLRFRMGNDYVRLHVPSSARVKQVAGEWQITLTLATGESQVIVLEHTKRPRSHYKGQDFEEPTKQFWQHWVSEGKFFGDEQEQLIRSAITLKLMQFYPTGAIVAAPTTSLPEEVGGLRNWDYRYVWIRDATFVLYALNVLGYRNEAKRFFRFIERVARHCSMCEVDLHLFYTIWGHRVPREQALHHFAGYKGSHPVRVGNDATDQFQLDIYGSLIDAHYFMSTRGIGVSRLSRAIIIELVNDIAEHWQDADNGIWEVRTGMQHYTYSKVMAWVGVSRALRLAKRLHINKKTITAWKKLEEEIAAWIWTYCFDEKRNTLVQHPETDSQDAVNYLIVLLQFFEQDDVRAKQTIDATSRELRYHDIFVYRYRENDGLAGGEGAFVLATFWLIAALAYTGNNKEARRLLTKFEKQLPKSGLIAEEIDPKTGEYLGNFPQAFSHIGYIMSAYYLDRYKGEQT